MNASALAEGLPTLVGTERAAVLDAIRHELAVLLESVDVQRVATLDFLGTELAALVSALATERILAFEAVERERVATIEAAVPLIQDAIDHAVWRAAQALAAVGLVAFALAAMVMFAFRRGPRSTGP
jgi:hypothetical protein